jgi:hypothetical protein
MLKRFWMVIKYLFSREGGGAMYDREWHKKEE